MGAVRIVFAAAVGLLLLPSGTRAACGAPGLRDPSSWASIIDENGVERCYKLFSGSYGSDEPFGTWADCVATCQANGAAGYDGSASGREATVGGVRDRAQANFISSLIDAERQPQERWNNRVWIGFNALEEPLATFRWASDGTVDPDSALAQPVEDYQVNLPWGGDEVWVGEGGTCAATQLCMTVTADPYDVLKGSLHQCDGPDAPARCLCEFSSVSSVAGTPFDTSDGVTPAVCDDREMSMCSSWHGDCLIAYDEAQTPTCRNGYTARISTGCDAFPRCTEYECCDPGTTLSRTMESANALVHVNGVNGEYMDEEACYWEAYWHYWVIGYSSLYAVLGLGFLIGFLIACKCCAPKQAFSTRLQDCCEDVGVCCMTCWCPCVTWGRIAEYALNLPSWIGCLTYCCCSNLTCCLGMVGRAELRKKLAIGAGIGTTSEDCCIDCCIHCCAHSCGLCQEAREVELAHSGRRPTPAPPPMGMVAVHSGAPLTVQAQIVGEAQPMQAAFSATPVVGHVVERAELPGEATTSNPVPKLEQQP